MGKTYKVRGYRIAVNVFYGLVVSVIIACLSSIWLNGLMIYLVGIIAFIIDICFVVFARLIRIEINGDDLIVKKGREVKYTFKISDCSFEANTRTSQGDTECKLIVITSDGFRTSVDCELIGIRNFEKICQDIRIIGDNAHVYDLKTRKE